MSNIFRLKRRAAGGAAGAPASLVAQELAYNEQDDTLYYGRGNNGSNLATSIVALAGKGIAVGPSQITPSDMFANQCVVGDFDDLLTGWTLGGGVITAANDATAVSGGSVATMDRTAATSGSNAISMTTSQYIPVEAGAFYELLGWFKGDTATVGGCYLRVLWYKPTKAASAVAGTVYPVGGAAGVTYTDAFANGPIATSWTRRGGLTSAPTDAAFARIQIYHYSTSTTRYMSVDHVTFRRATESTGLVEAAVTGSKLAPGPALASMLPNGDFEDGRNGWSIYSGAGSVAFTVGASAGGSEGSSYAALDRGTTASGTANLVITSNSFIPVEGGTYYELLGAFCGEAASAAGIYLRASWSDATGAYLSYTDAVANGAIPAAWAKQGSQIQSPSGARQVKIQVYHHTTSTCRYLYVDALTFRRAAGNSMLEPASVSYDKLAANAALANLSAGTLTSDKFADRAVTPSKLALSDPSNMLLNGCFCNIANNVASTEGWGLYPGSSTNPGSATDPGGLVRLVNTSSTDYWAAFSDMLEVRPGEYYYLSAMVYNQRAAGNIGVALNIINGDGTAAITQIYGTTTQTAAKNAWALVEGILQVPTGVNAGRVQFGLFADTSNGAAAFFGKSKMRRALSAAAIEPKAVGNLQLADMPALTIKGTTAGGIPMDLTGTQLLAIINAIAAALPTDPSALAAGTVWNNNGTWVIAQ